MKKKNDKPITVNPSGQCYGDVQRENLDHIVQETGVQTLKSEGLLRSLHCVPRTNSFHIHCSPDVLITWKVCLPMKSPSQIDIDPVFLFS